jgi:peptidoglycan hydrolase CwlO-like protein
MKKTKAFIAVLMISLLVSDISYANDFTEDIDSAREDLFNVNGDISNVSNEVSKLETEVAYLKEEKIHATKRLKLVEERILTKSDDLIGENKKLGEVINSIYVTENLLSDREDTFKKRVNSMYKEDYEIGWIDVILSSNGFSDLISKVNSYKTIVSIDKKIIDEYLDLMNDLESKELASTELVKTMDKMVKDLETLYRELDIALNDKKDIEIKLVSKIENLSVKLNNLIVSKNGIENNLAYLVIKKREYELELELEKERKIKEGERLKIERDERLKTAQFERLKIEQAERLKNASDGDKSLKHGQPLLDNNVDITIDKDFIHEEIRSDVKVGKEEIFQIVNKVSEKYGIPEKLILGVIQGESNFNNNAVNLNTNGTTDRGIMQLNSSTAPWLANRLGIDYKVGIEFIPEFAIEMGTLYLSDHYNEFDLHKTLSSYNRGPGGANKWHSEKGTYVTPYSNKIFGYMKNY